MTLSIGAVSFLNSRPLVRTLSDFESYDVRYSIPSACASELMKGAVDVALIPSIEYARSVKRLHIVPDLAIAAEGSVLTVRLFYKSDIKKIRRVAIDLSSRTSVALLRIILREKYEVDPECVEASPSLDEMLKIADAALVIGDPVFSYLDYSTPYMDLADEWTRFTGLPFVFAFWAGWPGVIDQKDLQRFFDSCKIGQESIFEIASAYSEANGGDPKLYEKYMRQNIRYSLGKQEQKGLNLFYEKAFLNGIVEKIPELLFYGE